MKTKKKIILSSLLLVLLVIVTVSISLANLNTDTVLRQEVDRRIQEWQDYCNQDILIASEANIKGKYENDKFEAIASLGPEYIPYLIEVIEKDSGITGYSLVAAVQRISKVSLKEWDRTTVWLGMWNKHLKTVSIKINELKEAFKQNNTKNIELKMEDVKKLGIPAVPYLIQEIKSGNYYMVDALRAIMSGDSSIPADNDKVKWEKWVKDNQNRFEGIKNLVENAKNK
ncbi:MAG: hypothetical protein ACOYWZ_13530 [Bacillota bacterium]